MSLFFRRRPQAAPVARDVERMLRQYGAEAYRVAGEMSWREDAGLLTAPDDGHWHRVHVEIGRRIGQSAPVWAPEKGLDDGRRSGLAPVEHREVRQSAAPLMEPRLRVAMPAEECRR